MEQKSGQEKLDVKIKLATSEDWTLLKDLRHSAITGEDAEMFGATPEKVAREQAITEQQVKDDIFNPEMVILLSWCGNELAGMVRAKKEKDGMWYIYANYIKPEFRGRIFMRKVFSKLLEEIKLKGGLKISMGVKTKNQIMIRLATLLGFQKVEDGLSGEGFFMEMDLNTQQNT